MKTDLLQYNQNEITLILEELNHAISASNKWIHDLHCGLILKEELPDKFLQKNAHKLTLFGRWLYSGPHSLLTSNTGVQDIEKCYRNLHKEAYKLACSHHENMDVPIKNYAAFAKHLSECREKTSAFRDALIETKGIFDSLTGLLGRQSLMMQLTREQSLVSRGLHECAIVMMDIDHFKSINDQYGHQSGDAALFSLAQSIRSSLRPYDSSFRYGGEEFLVCLPNTSKKNAFIAMDRLREKIASTPIGLPESQEVNATISMGIAMMESNIPIEESLARADAALYSAKQNGRNRVETAEPSDSNR